MTLTCKAVRQNDEMFCAHCNLRWEFADPEPPDCGLFRQGVEDDSDKASRPELIAPEMITGVGSVLKFGAEKYSDRNWEKGMQWSRPYGALQRHMWAWWGGENRDPETGMSHLWHAACCIMFLIAFESRGTGTDDRAVNPERK